MNTEYKRKFCGVKYNILFIIATYKKVKIDKLYWLIDEKLQGESQNPKYLTVFQHYTKITNVAYIPCNITLNKTIK